MDNFTHQLISTVLAVAFVGVLAWISIALLKRLQHGRAGRDGASRAAELRFVRAMPVGAKERVVVLSYRGEEWLLGVTPGGISLLSRDRPASGAGLPLPTTTDDPAVPPTPRSPPFDHSPSTR